MKKWVLLLFLLWASSNFYKPIADYKENINLYDLIIQAPPPHLKPPQFLSVFLMHIFLWFSWIFLLHCLPTKQNDDKNCWVQTDSNQFCIIQCLPINIRVEWLDPICLVFPTLIEFLFHKFRIYLIISFKKLISKGLKRSVREKWRGYRRTAKNNRFWLLLIFF